MNTTNRSSCTVRIAAIQMASVEGSIQANLEHASQLVEQAARAGVELALLPEFMPTGYLWSRRIWDTAESSKGLTVQWLRATSARLSIMLGTSFLESDGRDFFNTFVLTSDDGEEAGRVRKQFPSIGEAFFFKGEAGSHVIQTRFGRVGVAICFDAHSFPVAHTLSHQSVDLILMPHSYSVPCRPSAGVELEDIQRMKNNLRRIPTYYSRLLGVPAISVNKCGPAHAPKPTG